VRALLVADAGPDDGLGHVSRGSAVAVALGSRGIETRCYAHGRSAPLERDGVAWEPWSPESPLPSNVDVTIVDSYRLDPETVVATAIPLVVFSDDGEEHAAALVVSVAAPPSEDPSRLSGPRYAALRPEYWSLPPRDASGPLRRVLVTTGGGDPDGIGASIAQAVAARLPHVAVALVRGPHAPPPFSVDGVELLEAPDSLLEQQLAADLVISGGGQTMLEAAACGTPCLTLVLAENQRGQAFRLESSGAVVVVDPPDIDRIVAAIRGLDASARQELSRRGQLAVDGEGARRIAHHVETLLRQAV